MFILCWVYSQYFLQSGAGGEHPRGHLLLRQWHIQCASLSGAVQFAGQSYPRCRDSFPAVAPQLLRLWIELPAGCQTGKNQSEPTETWLCKSCGLYLNFVSVFELTSLSLIHNNLEEEKYSDPLFTQMQIMTRELVQINDLFANII